ncbi:hypothetical protein ACIQFU_22960 [Streptomyces sp. NPDC093065]|uniref:hypothetical protein n=1 Tax=Streptomyces sp. NPDC093065 TaxID=3366021 RepID=UPI00382FB2C6
MIITEALDALWSLGIAVLIWATLIATALVLALEALTVAVYAAVRAVWRLIRPESRPRPSWRLTRAHSRSYAKHLTDIDDAA